MDITSRVVAGLLLTSGAVVWPATARGARTRRLESCTRSSVLYEPVCCAISALGFAKALMIASILRASAREPYPARSTFKIGGTKARKILTRELRGKTDDSR
jgi:hypothetical protein